jgi:hypothetical protein
MCLYSKIGANPKYLPNKKNGGFIPEAPDIRVKAVPFGCGKCIECRQKKAREWQVRLHEELKDDTRALFMTMTFSNESLDKQRMENQESAPELGRAPPQKGNFVKRHLDNRIQIKSNQRRTIALWNI